MFIHSMFLLIKKDLALLEEELLQAVVSPVDRITEIGTHLVKSGGKRLRPALFLLAARSSKDFDAKKMMPLAVALELIHMASLVHDDVLDHADTRRGAVTANAMWGNQQAILSGDYFFARAFLLIVENGFGERVSRRIAQLIMDLSSGEIIQNKELYRASRDVEEYYERIAKKTANFLAICCELGAIATNLGAEAERGLHAYGKYVGMAFQITDDLLDLTSNEKKIGKPAGNDIHEGIVTLPVIRALEVSSEREELLSIVTNPSMTREDVERALAIVRASDGIEYARAKVREFLIEAKEALPAVLPDKVRDTFCRAADYIAKRES